MTVGALNYSGSTTIMPQTHNQVPIGVQHEGLALTLLALSISANVPIEVRATVALTTLLAWKWMVHTLSDSRSSRAYIYISAVWLTQYCLGTFAASLKGTRPKPLIKPDSAPLPPLLFPSRTIHTRRSPTSHSFAYSYLLVGIPVGWRHSTSVLAADPPPEAPSNSWLTVHASDYLSRAPHSYGLRGKLHAYLLAQHQNPEDYPFAYLVTAPRFLGFSFNPASFWYLYSPCMKLSAMIIEVNNTFDERRMYFIPVTQLHPDEKTPSRFTAIWDKDFHVSPFNDRQGFYSLTARSPFPASKIPSQDNAHDDLKEVKIDNTITLGSPSAPSSPHIVARVTSDRQPVNPFTLTTFQSYVFVARYAWIGFLTNPRILYEARKLWSKGLKVFCRPEPLATSIGRQATREEDEVESVFRGYLQWIVDMSARAIRYLPSAGSDNGETILLSPLGQEDARDGEQATSEDVIEVKILTPAFYTLLLTSPSLAGLWRERCFEAGDGDGLAFCSDPNALKLIVSQTMATLNKLQGLGRRCFHFRFGTRLRNGNGLVRSLFAALRCQSNGAANGDGLPFPGVLHNIASEKDARTLDKVAVKVLLAERTALGYVSGLRIYGTMLWWSFAYMIALQTSVVIEGRESQADYQIAIMVVAVCGLLGLRLLRAMYDTRKTGG